jgi:hypothetical protein
MAVSVERKGTADRNTIATPAPAKAAKVAT